MEHEQAVIGRRSYPRSLVYTCSLYCNAAEGILEYELGGHYSLFDSHIGLKNNAQSTTTKPIFELYRPDRTTAIFRQQGM